MTNDVEKRWNDPPTFRAATKYVVVVIVLAAIWLVADLLIDPSSLLWGAGSTAILLLGGIGAFIKGYRAWKHGGNWTIWQGAGWLLFALMLATMGTAAL